METIKAMAIFFIAYELAKLIMPKVELSWRMFSWQLKEAKVQKATMTEGPDGKLEIKMQPRPERPAIPAGIWLSVAKDFVYTIFCIVAFCSFNPVYMVCSVLMFIWSGVMGKKKPSVPMVMLDGVVSAAILIPFVLN